MYYYMTMRFLCICIAAFAAVALCSASADCAAAESYRETLENLESSVMTLLEIMHSSETANRNALTYGVFFARDLKDTVRSLRMFSREMGCAHAGKPA